jgi:hypothetical protein
MLDSCSLRRRALFPHHRGDRLTLDPSAYMATARAGNFYYPAEHGLLGPSPGQAMKPSRPAALAAGPLGRCRPRKRHRRFAPCADSRSTAMRTAMLGGPPTPPTNTEADATIGINVARGTDFSRSKWARNLVVVPRLRRAHPAAARVRETGRWVAEIKRGIRAARPVRPQASRPGVAHPVQAPASTGETTRQRLDVAGGVILPPIWLALAFLTRIALWAGILLGAPGGFGIRHGNGEHPAHRER